MYYDTISMIYKLSFHPIRRRRRARGSDKAFLVHPTDGGAAAARRPEADQKCSGHSSCAGLYYHFDDLRFRKTNNINTRWLSSYSHFKCSYLFQVNFWNVGCWNDSNTRTLISVSVNKILLQRRRHAGKTRIQNAKSGIAHCLFKRGE